MLFNFKIEIFHLERAKKKSIKLNSLHFQKMKLPDQRATVSDRLLYDLHHNKLRFHRKELSWITSFFERKLLTFLRWKYTLKEYSSFPYRKTEIFSSIREEFYSFKYIYVIHFLCRDFPTNISFELWRLRFELLLRNWFLRITFKTLLVYVWFTICPHKFQLIHFCSEII